MVDQIARLPRTASPPFPGFSLDSVRRGAEAILIPVGALLATAVVFGLFVAAAGADPLETYSLMYRGAFGTWFSWQNTLQRTAPLLLTALCVALPAKLGLVIIGGEGALEQEFLDRIFARLGAVAQQRDPIGRGRDALG